jgi:Tfp pilus assembly protein PilN
MSSPNQLSFLPDDYLDRKAQRRTNVICAILAAIVMGAIGSAFSLTERMVAAAEKRHSAIEQQYADAARQIQEVRDMEMKQRKMARQADLAASLLEKIPRSIILAEVTNALPTDVSMLQFNLDSRRISAPQQPQDKAAADGLLSTDPIVYDITLDVYGIASNDVQVAEFIHRLNHSPLFKDVNLVVSDELIKNEQKLRHFQVEMSLNNDADVTTLNNHLPASLTQPKASAAADLSDK